MTTTRLTLAKRGNFPTVEGCALRVYSEYQAMLSREAWEALGSPPAIAFETDDGVYSIVPAGLGEDGAIRVYGNRQVSIGVLAAALRGSAFPLRVTLVPEDGRLRFGEIA
jgi:hypothetical protein